MEQSTKQRAKSARRGLSFVVRAHPAERSAKERVERGLASSNIPVGGTLAAAAARQAQSR
jgi:hypothetical protein